MVSLLAILCGISLAVYMAMRIARPIAQLVAGVRKHEYGRPVSTMRAYLEAMKDKPYMAPAPPSETPVLLAALRPNMLRLAKELTRGAHPYFVPPEHTARAREILGRGPWLAPEQMVLREADRG